MAALGWSRKDTKISSQVGSRQAELIALLEASETDDPLVLEEPTRGLNKIDLGSRSSIGEKKRNMIYLAWKQFFINGIRDQDYPLDWQEGKNLS